jgi:hypothetical protein
MTRCMSTVLWVRQIEVCVMCSAIVCVQCVTICKRVCLCKGVSEYVCVSTPTTPYPTNTYPHSLSLTHSHTHAQVGSSRANAEGDTQYEQYLNQIFSPYGQLDSIRVMNGMCFVKYLRRKNAGMQMIITYAHMRLYTHTHAHTHTYLKRGLRRCEMECVKWRSVRSVFSGACVVQYRHSGVHVYVVYIYRLVPIIYLTLYYTIPQHTTTHCAHPNHTKPHLH